MRKQCETYKDGPDAYPKFLPCVKQWELYKDVTKVFISKHFCLERKKSLEATKEIFYQNKELWK